MEGTPKQQGGHHIPTDILDDLASRFIINTPEARSDLIRLCFQLELAHWFYLDFFCAKESTKLTSCGIKQFAVHIFHVTIFFLNLNITSNNFIFFSPAYSIFK